MKNTLQRLIEQGVTFSFKNCSQNNGYGDYSKPSEELLAWIAGIEHYLIENYEEESGPVRLFKSFNRTQLTGNYQSQFEEQLTILRGVLNCCTSIPPNKRKRGEDNAILNLIKNPIFWTVIVIVGGSSFSLGNYLGNAKFDNNLIELSRTNKTLQDSLFYKEQLLIKVKANSDSALNILGHMPYNEMSLDSLSFRKVQTNIESAGGALYLNK